MFDRSRWFSVDVMAERDLLGEARMGSVPGWKTGRLACLGTRSVGGDEQRRARALSRS